MAGGSSCSIPTGKLQRQWWMPDYSVVAEGVCVLNRMVACRRRHAYHRVVFFNHDGEVVGMFGKLGTDGANSSIRCASSRMTRDLYVCEYGNFNDRARSLSLMGVYQSDRGLWNRRRPVPAA